MVHPAVRMPGEVIDHLVRAKGMPCQNDVPVMALYSPILLPSFKGPFKPEWELPVRFE